MKPAPRVLVAGIFHETHTFLASRTGLADFAIRRGTELLARRGDGSTIDGCLEVAERHGWDVIAGVDYTALPSGMVEHEVFEAFWDDLRTPIAAAQAKGPIDGIWLALHGAMVTDRSFDPEGELLGRIRALPGLDAVPLFGVLDLHCNITPEMSRHANGLLAYRENPHIDARETAVRSAELLAHALESGVRPREMSRVAPVLWPPTGTATADRPMRDLEMIARRMEADPAVWGVNVFAGFAFADVPCAGVGFSVSSTDDALAARLLDELVDTAVALRDLGHPAEWDLDEAVGQIGAGGTGPVVIVEPADNIGAGSAGDSTTVLRAFLRHGVKRAAVAIADGTAVAALQPLSPGEATTLTLGGRSGEIGSEPLTVSATLVSRSDGKFTLEDAQSHLAASQGTLFDMGPTAAVKVDEILVLLTSRKTPPFDLGQFRSQGIVPEEMTAIGVKAAVAHRRAYDKIASASYTVSTLGPCSSDLRQLPYRHIRDGVHPLR